MYRNYKSSSPFLLNQQVLLGSEEYFTLLAEVLNQTLKYYINKILLVEFCRQLVQAILECLWQGVLDVSPTLPCMVFPVGSFLNEIQAETYI